MATVTKKPKATIIETEGGQYLLRLGVNAICDAEEALNMGMAEIMAKMKDSPSFATVRTMFMAGLRTIDGARLSKDEAGEVLEEYGMEKAIEALSEGIQRAFPADEVTEESKAKAA